MYNKSQALDIIKALIEKFSQYEKDYCQDSYLEMSVRSEFIDLFFGALNWDVANSKKLPPSECEVIRENHVSEKHNKRVDYIFKINNGIKFAVEAKKPSESLDKLDHIFQAKSYAFSLNVNLVILTNFKEFKIFDIKSKPLHNQPKTDLVEKYSFSYLEITDKFEEIWGLLEYNNVANGALKEFYINNRKGLSKKQIEESLKVYNKKGASLLDKAFLADLLNWRLRLAKNIYDSNEIKDVQLLNEVVQRIIDRIIFLRILEDKRIEDNDDLFNICQNWENKKTFSLKDSLENHFEKLNKKYNGLIFKHHEYISNMNIDDEILCSFIFSLYVPQSPYNFAVIEVNVLGKIFEQYLGHILIIENDNVDIVLKNENQKIAGIYYTRQEIVDKIVNETILPEINQIDTIEALENYRILDMACGSGSFVIEAFKAVVNRYQDIISELSEDKKGDYCNKFFCDNDNKVYLTMQYKKEIAQKNIYGVDIDPQAIEISKMSLYILMLEMNYMDDSVRPILPSLDNNFKVGNSIISEDFYDNNLWDPDIDKLSNPFNYEDDFADVFENGGFNAIIGNPPYIKIQTLNKYYPSCISEYIKCKFPNTAKGNFDMFVVFIEKAIELLADNGKLGMIVLSGFLTSKYGEGLRGLLSQKGYVTKIVDFGDLQVFDNSKAYTCLLYLQKSSNQTFLYEKVENYDDWKDLSNATSECLDKSVLSEHPWCFGDVLYNKLNSQVFNKCQRLKDIAVLFAGVQPTANSIYLVEIVRKDDEYYYCITEDNNEPIKLEKGAVKPVVKGSRDIFAYRHKYDKGLIFPYEIKDNKAILVSEEDYSNRFPKAYEYLSNYKDQLNKKHKKLTSASPWYRYEYVKNHGRFEQQKILAPSMMYGSRFSLDENGELYMTCGGAASGGGNSIIFKQEKDNYTFYSLLAILNSFVISYLIVRNGVPKSGGWKGVDKTFLEELYMPKINGDIEKQKILKKLDKNCRDIIKAVNQLDNSYKESETQRLKKRIAMFKNNINILVKDLYDIDDVSYEEILECIKDYL